MHVRVMQVRAVCVLVELGGWDEYVLFQYVFASTGMLVYAATWNAQYNY